MNRTQINEYVTDMGLEDEALVCVGNRAKKRRPPLPKLTDDQKQYILKNFKGCGQRQMALRLGASVFQVKKFYRDNNLISGLNGRFEKGSIPWSKGKTQEEIFKTPEALEHSRTTRFKKGAMPHNYVPVGTEVVKDGTHWIKIAAPNIWKQKHRMIYEQHYGARLREDELIIFLDGDRENFDVQNLRLVGMAENAVLGMHLKRISDAELQETLVKVAELTVACNRRRNENPPVTRNRRKGKYGNEKHPSGSE